MDSVIKSLVAYLILWLIIRGSGRRTLGQLTVFDFILFLMVGGVMQRALTAQDYSLTHAFLIIATFVVVDICVSLLERDVPSIARILKGVPTIVVENGRVLRGRLRRARLSEDEVLEAARTRHGLERMDEIKFAIFEASGEISIIPLRLDDRPRSIDGRSGRTEGGRRQEAADL
jgi:uncharacterized membrane protein YcaP (DUF421 family)